MKEPNPYSIFLSPTNSIEVSTLISSLQCKKSTGPNSIPTDILQLLNNEISTPISNIVNLSFSSGSFPDILEIAKVIPVFKNGSKLDVNNYRPISLLSNINKIFEKLMFSRIYSFLTLHNCIYELQYGFRAKHSTMHALVSITEKIRDSLDAGNFACGIFIDLQKAFDTVDHDILLKKLDHYGIRGNANNWIKSYLSNRKQFVSINGFESVLLPVTIGVPQGSVLGPLLFLLYINDLNSCVRYSIVHHFADDTNLLTISNSIKKLSRQVNCDLRSLTNWLKANKIALNIKKTEFILFKKPSAVINDFPFVKMDGKKISPSRQIKYLGIYIDENLSWKYHITQLSNKLCRANGMLSKIRHFVTPSLLKTIYHAIFSSHMRYGCIVWGQIGSPLRSRICNLQNKALRIMCFAKLFDKTKPLFVKLNLLQFSDVVLLENILLSHAFVTKSLPVSFNDFFSLTNIVHRYETRRTANVFFKVKMVNTTRFGLNSIKSLCVKSWNSLLLAHPMVNFQNIKKFSLITLVQKYLICSY